MLCTQQVKMDNLFGISCGEEPDQLPIITLGHTHPLSLPTVSPSRCTLHEEKPLGPQSGPNCPVLVHRVARNQCHHHSVIVHCILLCVVSRKSTVIVAVYIATSLMHQYY